MDKNVETPQAKTDGKLTQEDSAELVKLLGSRLTLAKKFGAPWRKDVKKWLSDYEIESFDKVDHDDLYNALQIPYIFSTVESNLPSIFESMPQLIMTHRGKRDEDFTKWVEQIWDYLVERLHLAEKIEDGGTMMLITGLLNFLTGWNTEIETVEEESEQPVMNDLGEQVATQKVTNKYEVPTKDLPYVSMPDYDRIFFSPESKFVVDDEENKIPYFLVLETMIPEQVEEVYGKKPTQNAYFDVGKLETGLTTESTGLVKDDLERANVYKYYGQLPKKYGGAGWKSSYVYRADFAGEQLLKEPERISKKPLILQGNYGTPVKFDRFGEPKVLRELEQDISLGRSMMADYRDRSSTKIWLPDKAEFDEASFKNPRKFAVVRSIGGVPPQYITPPAIPASIGQASDQDRVDIQMASAQLDISRGGDSNTVQTATGQQIFQNAMDRRINRKRKKIGDVIKALAKAILMLCAEHWEVDDFAEVTDDDPKNVAPFVEKLKKLGNDYDVDIEVETIMTNRATRSAQAIAFYKEIKDDPMANKEECLKFVIETGFGRKDPGRFINTMVTPDQVKNVLQMLIQHGAIDPAVADNVMAQMSQDGAPAPAPTAPLNLPTSDIGVDAQANASEVPNVQEPA